MVSRDFQDLNSRAIDDGFAHAVGISRAAERTGGGADVLRGVGRFCEVRERGAGGRTGVEGSGGCG